MRFPEVAAATGPVLREACPVESLATMVVSAARAPVRQEATPPDFAKKDMRGRTASFQSSAGESCFVSARPYLKFVARHSHSFINSLSSSLSGNIKVFFNKSPHLVNKCQERYTYLGLWILVPAVLEKETTGASKVWRSCKEGCKLEGLVSMSSPEWYEAWGHDDEHAGQTEGAVTELPLSWTGRDYLALWGLYLFEE